MPLALRLLLRRARSTWCAKGSGATVSWTLGVLDANTQSTLHVNVAGTLPSGSAAQSLTLQAVLTATGIGAGDATAQTSVQLMP